MVTTVLYIFKDILKYGGINDYWIKEPRGKV